MVQRLLRVRISLLKLIIYPVLGLCLYSVYIWRLKTDPVYDLSKSPEVLVDAVQQEPIGAISQDKQDLLSSKEYSTPNKKENVEILSEIEVYWRERVLKIKQNFGDSVKPNKIL